MRLLLAAATVLLFARGGFAMSGSPGPAPVIFVADGDTVRVVYRGVREWVRLLRIDTPEREQEGYEAARAALAQMVQGKEVELVFERPGKVERDTHGRLLAYLFVGDRNVNVEMVRAGWSPFWTRYGKGRFANAFRRAEREAKEAGRGLWRRRTGGSAVQGTFPRLTQPVIGIEFYEKTG